MRKLFSFIVFAAAALLSGCSATRLAYSNADVFLRWQANSYFDFNGEQGEELDRRIGAFLAWHRASALPQYVRLAEEAGRRLARGLVREDLVWGYDAVRAQARESLRAAAAEMAGLLDGLEPGQIEHLERRFAADNRRFAKEHLQGNVEQRRKRRLKRNLERLEEWFGPLSETQIERVRRYAERAPADYDEWRDRERRRLQAELLALLRAREARQRLADWAEHWDRDREPGHLAAARSLVAEAIDMMLDLDKTLTSAQRAQALERIHDYATDFATLARQ
jgi:hypothetical protein